MNYQETGNKIPITEAELINVMITKYDAYAQNPSLPNPDTEPVIYTTQEGKTIKIPDEIKMKAKGQMPQKVISVPVKVIQIYDESQKLTNIVILVVAVLIAAYLLYKFGNKFRDSYNIGTEELKLYLTRK